VLNPDESEWEWMPDGGGMTKLHGCAMRGFKKLNLLNTCNSCPRKALVEFASPAPEVKYMVESGKYGAG
jgi:hypothetical protein